jgi:hypothetical protein
MKKIMTVLAAAGMLMLGIAGQAAAADGGNLSCTQNGGSSASCHLYHIRLDGHNRCVDFTTDKLAPFRVCRRKSMNVYLDPKIVSSVTLNINTADDSDKIRVDNDKNYCFWTRDGSRKSGGVEHHYDKLQMVSMGDGCNES